MSSPPRVKRVSTMDDVVGALHSKPVDLIYLRFLERYHNEFPR